MHSFFYYVDADWQTYKSSVINADLEKLDLLGDEYIFDIFQERIDKLKYDTYITDALKCIIEVMARLGNSEVNYNRFIDMIRPKIKECSSNLSAEEIIAGMKNKLARLGGEK